MNNQFNKIFDEGARYYKIGKLQLALECFNNCIKLKPTDSLSYNNRGLIKFDQRDYRDALEDFNKAIEFDCDYYFAFYNRGLAKKGLALYEQAIEDFEHIIKKISKYEELLKEYQETIKDLNLPDGMANPINFPLNNKEHELVMNKDFKNDVLGEIDKIKQKINGKIEISIERIEFDKDPAEDFFKKGMIYLKNKNYVDAINKFDLAISKKPEKQIFYYERGFAKFNLNDFEGAFFDLNKCLEIEPNSINALLFRGNCRSSLKDYTGAVNDYTKLIELLPNDGQAYFNRAVAYYYSGFEKNFLNDLRKSAELGLEEAIDLLKKFDQPLKEG